VLKHVKKIYRTAMATTDFGKTFFDLYLNVN
jgi:hypothetical protein